MPLEALRVENAGGPDDRVITSDASVVSVECVGRRFRSRQGRVVALTDVSFTVARGEFLSVVGPSGCGKSTLLKLIAGLVRPTSGEIFALGESVSRPRRDVGMMFQRPVLLPWRNVLENVLLPVDIAKLDRGMYLARAKELLRLTELHQFSEHKVWQLSGGMQQRLALCRTLIVEPEVLLLDEPFGALDSLTREALNDALNDICVRTGITAILVTHDVAEAVYLSDRVLVMSARPGRIKASIDVPLGRKRDPSLRASPAFTAWCADVREQLSRPERR